MAGDDKVMETNLTNYIEGAPVKVHVDNVVRKFNGRNGEMIALNGVTLDIHDNEFISASSAPPAAARAPF